MLISNYRFHDWIDGNSPGGHPALLPDAPEWAKKEFAEFMGLLEEVTDDGVVINR